MSGLSESTFHLRKGKSITITSSNLHTILGILQRWKIIPSRILNINNTLAERS